LNTVAPSPFAEPERVEVAVPGGVLAGGLWPASSAPSPTVVALHDLTANHLVWGHLAVALGGRFVLAAPDLRGRSRSADLPGPAGLDRHAADLEAFAESVATGPVVLVGHGYGAWVVAQVAARRVHGASGVVLVDPLPDVAATTPVPPTVEGVFGAGLHRLGRTYPNRDAYLAEWRTLPGFRTGMDRLTQRALLADLRGSGFLWRPVADADMVVADAQEVLAARPGSGAALPDLLDPDTGLPAGGDARGPVEVLRPAAVASADHETLVLGDTGAAAVASAVERVLAGLPTPAAASDAATTD
jgi:pimeloyl-ACP methyl ester carboxylesterase